MEKEYGKLTADQFKAFVGKLPELRAQQGEMSALLKDLPREKFRKLMSDGVNWAEIYEGSFAEHIAICVVAFGLVKRLKEIGQSPDAQQAILDTWDQEILEQDIPTILEPGELVGLAYSLQRTVLSIMLYQRSISGLVQEVRDSDSMDSLFKAVRVDRAVVGCPTIAEKIARAEMRQDKRFFLNLRNALKGPTQKHWEAYRDLRYSLVVLREMGLGNLSDSELEKLLVHTLKVYPNTPSARKNLRAQYQQSRKLKTI